MPSPHPHRRGSPPSAPAPSFLALAIGVTLAVVAWGYLVYAAIDFGSRGRAAAMARPWAFLALASLGAVACLFAGLLLVARLLRMLGVIKSEEPPPRPAGGKRAAR